MTAATRDITTPWQLGEMEDYPVKGGVQIFDNTMVCLDAAGYAVPGADVAGYKFIGIAHGGVDSRLIADGVKNVRVKRVNEHDFESTGAAIDQTNIGDPMYIADDKTVSTVTANSIQAGKLVKVTTETKNARIWITPVTRAVS